MLSERTIELIHLRIDGQASPSEDAELAAILDSSAEARATLEDMGKLAMTLESAPLVQTPATLKKDVLAGIRQKRPSRFQWTGPQRRRIFGSATNFPTNRAVLTTEPGTDGLTDGWRQRMNSQKKRNFLIAFGGVAVVLVAVVATWPPAFLSEDARGTIGAVQKHRAPQITAKDVVLVDEATRREEAILYADYLQDAGKLERISVALRNSATNLEARSKGAKSLDNVAQDLQGHSAELQSRYLGRMSDALNAASELLAHNAAALSAHQLESVRGDIDSLSAKLKNREELASEEMEGLNSRLRSINDKLEARSAGVRSFESIEMALGSELASLEKASQLGSAAQLEASAILESLSHDLQGAQSALNVRIQHRQDHLEAIALEQRSLQSAEMALEAFSRNELGNTAEISNRLESASLDLANRASQLESQAIGNMQSRLKAQDEMAARFRNMDNALGSAKKALEGRASGLENRFNDALGSVAHELQTRSTELQAKMAARMQSELGAIESRLDSRANLSARLQNESQLEAHFASHSQLDAQLRTHLGALSRALGSQSNLGATLRNRQELELQASALESRFAGLEARER